MLFFHYLKYSWTTNTINMTIFDVVSYSYVFAQINPFPFCLRATAKQLKQLKAHESIYQGVTMCFLNKKRNGFPFKILHNHVNILEFNKHALTLELCNSGYVSVIIFDSNHWIGNMTLTAKVSLKFWDVPEKYYLSVNYFRFSYDPTKVRPIFPTDLYWRIWGTG